MCSLEQFESRFAEYRPELHLFARKIMRCGADADDLVHTAYLRARDYLRSGKNIHSPKSFLFTTVRNLATNDYRDNENRCADSTIDVDEIVLDEEPASIDEHIMSEEQFEELCVAISQLPERMRHVFVLRKVYGFSCQEIAEQLGTSTETVRKHVARAFKKLQAQRNRPEKSKRVNGSVKNARRLLSMAPVRNHD